MSDITEKARRVLELDAKATSGHWLANVWYGSDAGGWAAVGPHHKSREVAGEDSRTLEYEDDEPGGPVEARAKADAALVSEARNSAPDLARFALLVDELTRKAIEDNEGMRGDSPEWHYLACARDLRRRLGLDGGR